MIAKYLYEKKGYPIDMNGNLPSFDETMLAPTFSTILLVI